MDAPRVKGAKDSPSGIRIGSVHTRTLRVERVNAKLPVCLEPRTIVEIINNYTSRSSDSLGSESVARS